MFHLVYFPNVLWPQSENEYFVNIMSSLTLFLYLYNCRQGNTYRVSPSTNYNEETLRSFQSQMELKLQPDSKIAFLC